MSRPLHPPRMFSINFLKSDENIGFSRGVTRCLEVSSGEHVLLLNPDTLFTRGSLDRLSKHLTASKTVGAVGPTSNHVSLAQRIEPLLDKNVLKDRSADDVSRYLAQMNHDPQTAKLLIGFCLLMRRDVLEDVGGLDPDLFAGSDDLLLSYQLRSNGYKLVIATDTYVEHIGAVSFGTRDDAEKYYLGFQSCNRVYEKLYGELGKKAGDGKELFGIEWYHPITSTVSIVTLANGTTAQTIQRLNLILQSTNRDLEMVIVSDQPRP